MVKRKAATQGGRAGKRQKAGNKMRMVRGPTQSTVYAFKRIKEGPAITSDPNAPLGVTFPVKSFALNELALNSEFINLFGQYRIKAIDMHCCPRVNSAMPADGGKYSIFHYAVDLTNATPYTASTDIYQAQNVKRVNLNNGKDWHIRFTPRAAEAVFAGAVSASGYAVQPESQWISTDGTGPQCPHYGLRCMWMTNYLSAIEIYVTYQIEFRNVR